MIRNADGWLRARTSVNRSFCGSWAEHGPSGVVYNAEQYERCWVVTRTHVYEPQVLRLVGCARPSRAQAALWKRNKKIYFNLLDYFYNCLEDDVTHTRVIRNKRMLPKVAPLPTSSLQCNKRIQEVQSTATSRC